MPWIGAMLGKGEGNMLFLIKNFFYIYLFTFERERERDRAQVGDGQREKTQNLKKVPGSELSAQSRKQGSNSQAARS